jgi:hypothetical protein
MNKQLLPAFLACFCFIQSSIAQQSSGSAEITYGNHATHVAGINFDSIILITGTTYSFTVDTPEDKGLVSTRLNVRQLPLQIAAADGSVQTYALTGNNGNGRSEGDIETGDKLVVTSADGRLIKTYHISVQPMALSGQLRLEQKAITVNTSKDLTLYFTAGQRSPNTTVRLYIPEGIEITDDNTTVNVIGRGDVKLKNLATQSMGRLGTHYSYKKAGNFAVSKKPDGGSVLLFKHLDLRPSNGADLKIVITGQKLKKTGSYLFPKY